MLGNFPSQPNSPNVHSNGNSALLGNLLKSPKLKEKIEQQIIKEKLENTAFKYLPNGSLKFRQLSSSDKLSIQQVLNKMTHRFKVVYQFFDIIIRYYLNFLKLTDDIASACGPVINVNINNLLLEKNRNLRQMSWYLLLALNAEETLEKAEKLMGKIRNSNPRDEIEMEIIANALYKKQFNDICLDKRKAKILNEIEESMNINFFSDEFAVSYPDFEENKNCTQFVKEFKVKPLTSMKELLVQLKIFSKLLSISFTKGPFYSIYLIKDLNEWINYHFGAVEIEFQINIIRLISGNLEDYRVLAGIMQTQHFCPAQRNNPFLQLFVNSLIFDVSSS